MCVPAIAKNDMYKESGTSLVLPVFLPFHRAAGVSAARVFALLRTPVITRASFRQATLGTLRIYDGNGEDDA